MYFIGQKSAKKRHYIFKTHVITQNIKRSSTFSQNNFCCSSNLGFLILYFQLKKAFFYILCNDMDFKYIVPCFLALFWPMKHILTFLTEKYHVFGKSVIIGVICYLADTASLSSDIFIITQQRGTNSSSSSSFLLLSPTSLSLL